MVCQHSLRQDQETNLEIGQRGFGNAAKMKSPCGKVTFIDTPRINIDGKTSLLKMVSVDCLI